MTCIWTYNAPSVKLLASVLPTRSGWHSHLSYLRIALSTIDSRLVTILVLTLVRVVPFRGCNFDYFVLSIVVLEGMHLFVSQVALWRQTGTRGSVVHSLPSFVMILLESGHIWNTFIIGLFMKKIWLMFVVKELLLLLTSIVMETLLILALSGHLHLFELALNLQELSLELQIAFSRGLRLTFYRLLIFSFLQRNVWFIHTLVGGLKVGCVVSDPLACLFCCVPITVLTRICDNHLCLLPWINVCIVFSSLRAKWLDLLIDVDRVARRPLWASESAMAKVDHMARLVRSACCCWVDCQFIFIIVRNVFAFFLRWWMKSCALQLCDADVSWHFLIILAVLVVSLCQSHPSRHHLGHLIVIFKFIKVIGVLKNTDFRIKLVLQNRCFFDIWVSIIALVVSISFTISHENQWLLYIFNCLTNVTFSPLAALQHFLTIFIFVILAKVVVFDHMLELRCSLNLRVGLLAARLR